MARKPEALPTTDASETVAPASGDSVFTETTAPVDPNLFNGADPVLFDHDGDGLPGGSLPDNVTANAMEPTVAQAEPVAASDTTGSIQQPSIGRIVHYYENSAGSPVPAMITSVNEAGVTLTIFRTAWTQANANFTPHVSELTADGPAWKWPDYVPSVQGIANVSVSADQFPGATGSTVFGEQRR